MEETFNINDNVIIKSDETLKKYKIIKINKNTFKCVDEENCKLLINKNEVKFYDENYYLIDDDVEYHIIIDVGQIKKIYHKYKTMNEMFNKIAEYHMLDELNCTFKKHICKKILENFHYSYATNENLRYSLINVDIYKVDIFENYKNCEIICTCPSGFKGCGEFCKKHR